MMRRSSLPLLLGLTVVAPLRAEQASVAASAVERADRLFREGTSAFEAERYSEAYGALRSAWDLAPGYRNAAGLGQVELHLTQYRDAAEHLAYCLRNFPESGDPVAHRHVEEGLEQAREHVAALRLHVNPEGAEIAVDGASVGRAPLEGLVFVNPGAHVVQASAKGRVTATQTADAPVGVTREVSLSLLPSPALEESPGALASAQPAPASTAPRGRNSEAGLSPTTLSLLIGGALTAAAVGTAVVFEVKGASADRDAEELRRGIGTSGDCTTPSPVRAPLCARLATLADERNRDDHLAMIFAVTASVLGAATVGTAIVLESRGPARDASAKTLSVRARTTSGGAAVTLGGLF